MVNHTSGNCKRFITLQETVSDMQHKFVSDLFQFMYVVYQNKILSARP